MRVRTAITTSLTVALAAGSLALVVVAPNGIGGSATRTGTTVAFDGYANLDTAGPGEILYGLTDFADASVADAVGADLKTATVQELADGSGVKFTWNLGSDLPPEGVPEFVRYNWGFQAGNQTYQLQVKRTNLANSSTAEAPLEHAFQAADGGWWFQLRGACVASYPAEPSTVNGCYHLGFFTGSVDTATGTVSMVLPYGAKDDIGRVVAGTFKRGTPIVEAQSAAMSITASIQAAVSNTSTSAFINGWGTFFPGTVIYAALGNATGPTGAYAFVDTAGDGMFKGSLSGAGTHVWVKACTGYDIVEEPCIARSIAIG